MQTLHRKEGEKMDRCYFIQKEDIIGALAAGCRVYYTEKGSLEIYEFTNNDPLSDLKTAEQFIALKGDN
jgi:hypothetical protein